MLFALLTLYCKHGCFNPSLPLLFSLLITETDVTPEEVKQMSEWLKNNVWPVTQVTQYMLKTAVHRARWIRDVGKNLQSIVEEFPRFLDTPGMVSLHLTDYV